MLGFYFFFLADQSLLHPAVTDPLAVAKGLVTLLSGLDVQIKLR
jgi:hypothetical protein